MIASRYRATAAAVALLTLGVCAAQAAPAPLTSDQPSLRLRGFDALAQRDYGCGFGPAGPIPPGGYWHYGTFYGCRPDRDRGPRYHDGPRRGPRDYGCGVGPAGPIPPGGYWHYGRFYPCPR